MSFRILSIIILFITTLCVDTYSQGNCIGIVGAIYGSSAGNERGKSLAATPSNNGFYAAGSKEDSVVILKVDLNGIIEWSRTLDVVPDIEEHVSAIIVDSEGMIAIAGISGDQGSGGSIFAFRYNPNTNQILWAKDYLSSPNNYCFSFIQLGGGGNYLLSNNPHYNAVSNNDGELLELNKNTGALIPVFTKDYELGSSEELTDIIYYGGNIYGAGRFTDGPSPADMRHTIVKLNASDGSIIWCKMSHVPANLTARLYAADLVINQDEIYSVSYGDPSGTSLTNTKLYIQKTSLDGTLIWLKQYELPGSNEIGYEIIKSDNGFVILAIKQASPRELILFKIDPSGGLLWGKTYQFSSIITSANLDRGVSQLIEVGNKLIFTAIGINSSGGTDMIIVRTNLEGETDSPCVGYQSISIPVQIINSPTFYSVTPTVFTVSPGMSAHSPEIIETNLMPREECIILDTLYSFIDITICDGDQYEGYTVEGVYVDNFTTVQGCDSIRTLNLDVNNSNSSIEQVEICLGLSYEGYSVSGIYLDTFQNILGCDSIHTLILNVIAIEINLDVEICEGQQYDGYSETGNYIDTIQGVFNSCDTIRYLNLNVQPIDQTFIDQVICEGESYEGYSIPGVYIDVFNNVQGCDSIRTLDLTVIDEINTEENIIICLGETYQGYSWPGTYIDTFQNVFGCDSIHTLVLDVEALEINLLIMICEGEQYDGYTIEGFYIDTLQGLFNSCDTIRYLESLLSGKSSEGN